MYVLDSDIDEIVRRMGNDVEFFAGRTVLLTGGLGFLGRYYLSFFRKINDGRVATPCKVLVVDNGVTGATADQVGGGDDWIRIIDQDVVEPFQIDGRVDYILHAAGIASPFYYRKYPLETLEVAIMGTRRLLDVALEHSVDGFVFHSSSEIYGDPDHRHVPTPESYRGNVACLGPRACYDESKRVGETLCGIYKELHGTATRIVRPFNIYGPGMQELDYRVVPNFGSRIIAGKPLRVYGVGSQTRTFCYITDAIVGFLKALLHGVDGQPYNIGNSTPEISMLELVRQFELVVGHDLEVQVIEYPDSYPADEPQRRCPDLSKALNHLGYRPEVALDDGLGRFMSWAKEQYTGLQG